MNSREMAARLIENRPEIANNPMAKEWVEIIRNGDDERGEEVANNLLRNYGITKEEGIEAALRFFGLRA